MPRFNLIRHRLSRSNRKHRSPAPIPFSSPSIGIGAHESVVIRDKKQ